MGPLATFRKLSRVNPKERVQEPECSFPRRAGQGLVLREGPKGPGPSAGKQVGP